ncbi:MAG: molybdopterin cofactor-binding domain-containing protein [Myxococcota bacterium]
MKINRRTLLMAGGIAGGGLLLGSVGLGVYVNTYDQRSAQRRSLPPSAAELVASFILVEPDGRVRILSPHTEMGQGAQTSLLQIVLDELDADPKTTTIELAPSLSGFTNPDILYGLFEELGVGEGWSESFLRSVAGRIATLTSLSFTGGSSSIRSTGWLGFRRAAASARMLLSETGAAALGVPVAQVVTRNSHVIHEASGKKVSYGELASEVAALPLPEEPIYKPRSEYKYIGTAYNRIDLPDKIFGKPVYGIDAEVPGMRYASVAPPTVAGGKVTGVANRAALEAMPGVEAVLVLDNCVAIVADKVWRAEWAAKKAQVITETPDHGILVGPALMDRRFAAIEKGSLSTIISEGKVDGPLSGDDVIEARYSLPFLAHAPMEPLNCTIWPEGDKIHVATGVQGPINARIAIADAMGLSVDDVALHARTMGGAFGRRNSLIYDALNYVTTTCEVQKAVGGAIKMTFSREAEMRMSTYRPADAAIMQARLGPDGKPTEWYGRLYITAAPSLPDTAASALPRRRARGSRRGGAWPVDGSTGRQPVGRSHRPARRTHRFVAPRGPAHRESSRDAVSKGRAGRLCRHLRSGHPPSLHELPPRWPCATAGRR